ncbi:PAS domain S-box protein [Flavobacterium sp. MAHUQ-51]|uniref:PAS domain S-box protein n=1 Tax=Flavobacterium sp. GCM10022190 TaxID=3252639 RepID=UPI003622C8BF
MKFNTALCITSLSLALYFINSGISIQNKYLSKILAAFVLLIGTLTLIEGIFQINLGIDELIVKDFDPRFPKNIVPGRMSQTSAFSFVLMGTSFLLINSKKKTIQIICNILLNVTTLITFIAALGYLYNVPTFYKLAFLTSMAVHTSIALCTLSIAASLVNYKIGLVGIYTGYKIGNKMARILSLQIVTMIIILTYLRLLTHRFDYVSVEFGIILFSICFILSSIFIITKTAKTLNQIEFKKIQAEISLLTVNSFLNATPDPMVIVDENGLIQTVNDKLESEIGYTKEELINQPIKTILPEINFIKDDISNKNNTININVNFASKKDKTEIPVEVSLNKVTINNKQWTSASIRNISKQYKISERLKLATNNSSIGIWDYDVINNILVWDDIMMHLYGVEKENFKGAYEAWAEGVHPDDLDRAVLEFQLALKGEKEFDTNFRVVWPNGSVRYLKAKAIVHWDSSGKPTRMVGTNHDITANVEFQNKIKESNERNMIFIEQAPGAIAMFDSNMCYMAASKQWIKDYKLTGLDLIGKSHYEIFPEIGDEWKKIHQDCLNGEINQCDESIFEREDGSIQWITWDVRPWYLYENKIGGIIMYTADITHIKQKDLEKRKIEEILDKTNEVARIGTWEVNLKSNTIHWSRITKEIHEVPQDYQPELTTAINFFKPGESRDQIQKAVGEAIENGTPYDLEVELTTLKGNNIWARAIGQAEFEKGKCSRLYGVFQDITKIKQTEKTLSRANEELKAIFNNELISIIVTDPNGTITHFNTGAERMLHYSAEEMIEIKNPIILHLENEVNQQGIQLSEKLGREITGFEVLAEIAKNGNQKSEEWTYVRKDGSILHVLLTITALKSEDGEILGFLETGIDVTEKLENQHNLIIAKENLEILAEKLSSQNKQLANFAHITSHNLRSPVGNLNTLLSLYNDSDDEEEKTLLFEKFGIVIGHLTSTLNSLIEALLIKEKSITNLENIEFESVFKKIKEIVTAQIMETKTEIKADFSLAPNLLYNNEYLESILLNLLTNAIKYRSPERNPKIEIKTYLEEDKTVLTFSDNGLGINLDRHKDKLFGLHKTFHRNSDAKGVGLYLTKTQIESMGGTISAESEVDKGTTFKIVF